MVVGQRTVLAQQAMDASDVIHMTFRKRVVGKSPPRRLLVQVPDGPSTDGGKRARQSITLAPENGEGPAIMCGWLDVGSKQAELRGYELVAVQYQKRFGHPFDVTIQEYRDLMQDLQRILHNLSVETRHAVVGPSAPRASVSRQEEDASSSGGRVLPWLLLMALVGGAAAFFLLR